MWTVGKPSPQEAEAWGLKQALMWLMNLGFSKLVVDGMTVIPSHRKVLGSILCACTTSLYSLPNFGISFIRRQANNVAHHLASGIVLC